MNQIDFIQSQAYSVVLETHVITSTGHLKLFTPKRGILASELLSFRHIGKIQMHHCRSNIARGKAIAGVFLFAKISLDFHATKSAYTKPCFEHGNTFIKFKNPAC
jgi:hypothetical protein